MQSVIVIGGGLAGLSASVSLAKSNYKVTLLEASPHPGGRAYSFYDDQFNAVIDNGQHIMMGAYKETINFLETINAAENFYFQENLEIIFFKSGAYYPLKSSRSIYPFNFIKSILSFRLLTAKERFELLGFFMLIPLTSTRDVEKLSAEEWLTKNKQGDNVRKIFWDAFIIGALNTTPEKASALMLRKILLKVFFSGRKSAVIIIPSKPLSDAFSLPAIKYLEENNGEVSYPERVLKLLSDRGNREIKKIITNKRTITDFNYIISAVPLYSLKKMIPGIIPDDFQLESSPILTVHFKSKAELFPHDFIAAAGSPIHWIFKHQDHYTIVISSAVEYINESITTLENFIKEELCAQFNLGRENFTAMKIIKEKRATFIPGTGAENRPGCATNYKNLFLAGDWLNTGLPSTIEGAVQSGIMAAKEITG